MKAIVNTESEDTSCEDLLSAPLFDITITSIDQSCPLKS